MTYPNRMRAWRTGVVDGIAQPFDLTMGMSFGDDPSDRRNLSYDAGVNVGQVIGRTAASVRRVTYRWLP